MKVVTKLSQPVKRGMFQLCSRVSYDFFQVYPRIVLGFIFRVELFDYALNGRDLNNRIILKSYLLIGNDAVTFWQFLISHFQQQRIKRCLLSYCLCDHSCWKIKDWKDIRLERTKTVCMNLKGLQKLLFEGVF